MSEWTWDEAIAELEATAKCRCEPCWTDRGMHAPECESELASVIEALREHERYNVLYREVVVGEGTWQRFQDLQARAEAAEQRVRELEADARRWAWLRDRHDRTRQDWHVRDPLNNAPGIGELDAAIDAAIAKDAAEQGKGEGS